MNKFFLFFYLNFYRIYSHKITENEKFFLNFFIKDDSNIFSKEIDFKNVDHIKGNILSNHINNENTIFIITEIDKYIFLYTYDFLNKKKTYLPLKIKNNNEKYKISLYKDYLFFISESGTLHIYNLLTKNIINIPNNFITPIYTPPLIIEKNQKIIIYLLHGYDMVSVLGIENINMDEPKIYKKIIHQQPIYNNVYYNFNENMDYINDYLVFPSKDGYLNVYKNNDFLWRKKFGDNFSPLCKIVNIDNNHFIFGNSLYNNEVFLYNLEGRKIWNHEITSLLNNIYYNNYFIIVDIKNNIYFIDKEGKLLFSKNLLEKLKKSDKFSKIFNYFLLNNKFVFFTDKGIFIFNKNLSEYKIIYLNINTYNFSSVIMKDKYLFFTINNKLFKLS
jgi:hypothetical protein